MKRKKKYQLGGEVEGGEVLQLPNSDLVEIEGPSHAQGGVDIPMPEGTVVFSDKLVGPDGTSFAERKKKRDKQLKSAFEKIEEDPFDVINRFTLERVMETSFLQESTDLAVQNMANFVDEYAYGGKVKYEKGGKVSNKISTLVGEGYSQKQAVAIALNMKKKGKLENGGKYQLGTTGNPLLPMLLMTQFAKGIQNAEQAGQVIDPTVIPPPLGDRGDLPEEGLTTYQKPGFLEGLFGKKTDTGDAIAGVAGSLGIGGVGGAVGALAPLVSTLFNRAGDQGIPNFYEDFGADALSANQSAMRSAASTRDFTLRQSRLTEAGQKESNRNARSLSTKTALDQAGAARTGLETARASTQYFRDLGQLFQQRAGLENEQDRMRMAGRETQFTETEKQRDNFFTQLSSSLSTLGSGMMHLGKMKNRVPDPSVDLVKLLGLDFLK